jgi:hypothetical protein
MITTRNRIAALRRTWRALRQLKTGTAEGNDKDSVFFLIPFAAPPGP